MLVRRRLARERGRDVNVIATDEELWQLATDLPSQSDRYPGGLINEIEHFKRENRIETDTCGLKRPAVPHTEEPPAKKPKLAFS